MAVGQGPASKGMQHFKCGVHTSTEALPLGEGCSPMTRITSDVSNNKQLLSHQPCTSHDHLIKCQQQPIIQASQTVCTSQQSKGRTKTYDTHPNRSDWGIMPQLRVGMIPTRPTTNGSRYRCISAALSVPQVWQGWAVRGSRYLQPG